MQDMGFGVSQRVEMERLKHAREQQIAATIEDIASIQKARVLLAMPKENVFARREKKASATVVQRLSAVPLLQVKRLMLLSISLRVVCKTWSRLR